MKQHGLVQPNGLDKKEIYQREARSDMPRNQINPASAGNQNSSTQKHGTKTKERKQRGLKNS